MQNRTWLLLLGISILLPGAAWANMYAPTMVQLISAPLLWSFYVVTLIITVPLILGISALEALTIRRAIPELPFKRLLLFLVVINFLTSLFRPPTVDEESYWTTFGIAFLLTIPAEAFLLGGLLGKPVKLTSAYQVIGVSLRMNIASYLVLGALLASMIYLPQWLTDKPEILPHAKGTIIAVNESSGLTAIAASGGVILIDQSYNYVEGWGTVQSRDALQHYQDQLYRVRIQDGRLIEEGLGERPIIDEASVPYRERQSKLFPETKIVVAISDDAQRMVLGDGEDCQIVDLTSKRELFPGNSVARYYHTNIFSPDNRYLAVTNLWLAASSPSTQMIDLTTGKVQSFAGVRGVAFGPDNQIAWISGKHIKVGEEIGKPNRSYEVGSFDYGELAWSPDGRYVAFAGTVNRYTTNSWGTDVRILELATGKTAIVHHDLSTIDRGLRLFWIK